MDGKFPKGPEKNCGATELVPGQDSWRTLNIFSGLALFPVIGAARTMGRLDPKRKIRRDLIAMAIVAW